MDILGNIGMGFSVVLTPANVFFCFLGALLGTLVGVLPGLGPAATIAFLLPITYKMSPVTAIILLAGNFLWGAVRWLDHLNLGQYPGRGNFGHYLSGWL